MTLRELEKRLEKEPDNLPLRVTLAGMMREAGRTPEAVELYRSVALAYRDQGRHQQAVAVCKSILELAPDDTAIHALLAELVQHHKGRGSHDTANQYSAVIEANTPPGGTSTRARTPSGAQETETRDPGIDPPTGRTPTGQRPAPSASRPPATSDSGRTPPIARTTTSDSGRTPPSGSRPPATSDSGRTPPSASRPPATSESGRTPPSASRPPATSDSGRTPPIARTTTSDSGRTPPSASRPPATSDSGRMPPTARTSTSDRAASTPKPEAIGRRPPSAQIPAARPTSQAEETVPRTANPPRVSSQAEDTVTRPPTARTPTAQPVIGKSTPSTGMKPLVPSPAGTGSRPPASVAKRAAMLTPPTGNPSRPSITEGPKRRSSMEETPLPRPVPYHVHDPTTSANRVPREAIAENLPHAEGDPTRPGGEPEDHPDMTGLAQAARRISGLINPDQLPLLRDSAGSGAVVDMAAELETRQRPRLEPRDIDKISQPPPTVPIEMIDEHELPTPPPGTSPSPWGRPATHPAVPIRDTPRDPPTDLNAIAEGVRSRDTDEELTAPRELLAADPLANAFFLPLPANRREAALVRCVRRPARAGTTVIRQGETSHPLILVVTGRLELRVERPNGTLAMLDTIDPGQYIGEAALLGRTPATANVIAASDCELLALPPHALFELAGAYPALWAALKDSAERRTRQYDKLIRAST